MVRSRNRAWESRWSLRTWALSAVLPETHSRPARPRSHWTKQISLAYSSTWTYGRGFPVLMDFKVGGRRYAKEVFDEVVPAPADQVQIPAFAVIHVRNDEHVEVFVCLHQCVGKSHGLHHVNVVIDVPMD